MSLRASVLASCSPEDCHSPACVASGEGKARRPEMQGLNANYCQGRGIDDPEQPLIINTPLKWGLDFGRSYGGLARIFLGF